MLFGLCRSKWMTKWLSFFLVPSQSSSMPLYPPKCCELASVPRLLALPLFSFQTHIWSLSRSQGVRHFSIHLLNTNMLSGHCKDIFKKGMLATFVQSLFIIMKVLNSNPVANRWNSYQIFYHWSNSKVLLKVCCLTILKF